MQPPCTGTAGSHVVPSSVLAAHSLTPGYCWQKETPRLFACREVPTAGPMPTVGWSGVNEQGNDGCQLSPSSVVTARIEQMPSSPPARVTPDHGSVTRIGSMLNPVYGDETSVHVPSVNFSR